MFQLIRDYIQLPSPLPSFPTLPAFTAFESDTEFGLHTLELHAPLVHLSSLRTDTLTDETAAAALDSMAPSIQRRTST